MIPKKFAKPQSQIQNIYFRLGKKNQGAIFVDHLLYYCYFIIAFGNMLFPMLTADWLHLVRYTSLQNIIIPDSAVNSVPFPFPCPILYPSLSLHGEAEWYPLLTSFL
jgi:hypothetical protein